MAEIISDIIRMESGVVPTREWDKISKVNS